MKIIKKIRHFIKKNKGAKNITLQSKMIVLYSLIFIITLFVIGYISILMFTSTVESNSIEYSYQIIDLVKKNIDHYIDEMDTISKITNFDYNIQYFLNSKTHSLEEQLDYSTQIADFLDSIINMRTDIETIILLGNNGSLITNKNTNKLNLDYNFHKQNWYKEAILSRGTPIILKPHRQSYVFDSQALVFSLSSSINSFNSNQQIGVILIDLNMEVLNEICSNVTLGNSGYVFIIDNEGNFIYHPDYSYIYRAWDELYIKEIFKADDPLISRILYNNEENFKMKFEDREVQITSLKMPSTGWTIVGLDPMEKVSKQINQIRLAIIIIGILCLMTAIFTTIFVSSLIFKPLNKLKLLMGSAESGNLDVSLKVNSNDEIGKLSTSFNQMIRRIKRLMEKVRIEEEEKRKAEFKALQAQINPHFLYNTLDSIVWMAESNRKEVVVMADSLAKLFRLSLSKGHQIIPIEDELEHVKHYLTIQSMRYIDKFDYIFEIDDYIKQYQTLKLILQPLVENALYHGIKNMRRKGIIIIKGRLVDDKILLQVMDDGIGMSKEELDTILNIHPTGEGLRKSFSGIGVKNVSERIKLYFGKEYGLEFISEKKVGTVVNIWIPALKPGEIYERDN